ncbi:MAG: TetR/AcrR family transcriptional regulator [Butyrivibrio sp.]|nr:TetR/AcrR family transcriptional regulator [Butyrivibrio sp.]
MWDREKEARQMASRRHEFLEKGFEIFAERGIEGVTLQDVAAATGCGMATIYRYFAKKPGFVVAVATWKWEQFREDNVNRRPTADLEGMSAAEIMDFYLDSFLELYRNHRDLLRFNQFFNDYVQSERLDTQILQPYQDIIREFRKPFHIMYCKAGEDGTVRTDESEETMFSVTIHLMLAAITRYAIGLVYIPDDFDEERELLVLKEMLMDRYCK